ncbi:helix-turn-helix domain-containing protein [Pseudomonas sp. 10B1]|uniref:helix-turn-helix transcriptional regulator n=1 Tax=unclassified Pseudomonas TaxID=196821 RepID=UPI002B23BE6A|nr:MULTISPECIES: helix-turn-helix domain-containing protein [unclassified Pseudomonas]MEA9996276.1 helix-turn-helix domain-containing protein [Pseudomonas sp. AA4]MEB0086682.1 helix-turn-helix domain-containing protein [Pseudomonas sp. RTI1]MEB0124732.1 helix-turn-helix domain-containing protein [Pseudomonas sp. CCC1.2]MEB0154895.1 helix-turn-helix domain-containing protein [Pseudomonas sp. CCC4.3]MEB0217895.1 helix-turn-helix domain-containing protein [Pseudomonas sp. AB12(2023)]
MNTNTQGKRLAYPINEAVHLLGTSRSSLYRLVKQGHLQLVKLGARRSAITRDSILKFAESLQIPIPADM